MLIFNFEPVVLIAGAVIIALCIRHQSTWWVGLFEGCAITLLIAAIIPKG